MHDNSCNPTRDIEFLGTKIQNGHNNGMNDVDISDQLRKVYCLNFWVKNTKWW